MGSDKIGEPLVMDRQLPHVDRFDDRPVNVYHIVARNICSDEHAGLAGVIVSGASGSIFGLVRVAGTGKAVHLTNESAIVLACLEMYPLPLSDV